MTEKIVFIIFFFESTQKLEVEISQKERKQKEKERGDNKERGENSLE